MKRNVFIFLFSGVAFVLLLHPPSLAASERFVDNGDGTVTDTELHLMWAAEDNLGDIDWHQAEKWIRYTFPTSLPVMYDNWRLPTLNELQTLFVKNSDYQGYEAECGQKIRIIPQIHLSCGFVWTGDRENVSARVFNFVRGTFYTDRLVHRRGYRALAVRDIR